MRRLDLVISDEAVADLVDVWTCIAQDSPDQADRLIDQIHRTCETLAENPLFGRQRDELSPGMRSFPVGRYLVFHRIVGATLQVVRVQRVSRPGRLVLTIQDEAADRSVQHSCTGPLTL